MLKTIKGKLTISVIGIVIVSVLLTTAGVAAVAGNRMVRDQTQALQLNADKYAEEINTWIENEKMLVDGATDSIAAGKETKTEFVQSAGHSNGNSAAVMQQIEELFHLSELLNKTVASFKV